MGNGELNEGRESYKIEAPQSQWYLPPKSMREMMKTRAGLILCYVVIGLIGLESLIMIVYLFSATYPMKSLAQPLTEESLRIYKEARSAVVDDVLQISNLFLGSVLLPILTLLLGYMFGSREENTETNEGD